VAVGSSGCVFSFPTKAEALEFKAIEKEKDSATILHAAQSANPIYHAEVGSILSRTTETFRASAKQLVEFEISVCISARPEFLFKELKW
jgi:hypothetical protein